MVTQSTNPFVTTELRIPDSIKEKPAWIRLEDQLNWYDRKSCYCQKWYKYLKIIQIILAVGVPVFIHFPSIWATWITSGAGAFIAVIESIQHLNQYSTLWILYRSTAERLKHEKFLFLSGAGPYFDLDEASRIVRLSERVEEFISTEHANWFNETQRGLRDNKGESA
ncbi:MAG TPA: DUF4231 domain-containing protein [Anaerohalosphaeraceae bacterium]|nr:DUF4231 domain-containing protein [Anaerohalosphaeraceae bacterium]